LEIEEHSKGERENNGTSIDFLQDLAKVFLEGLSQASIKHSTAEGIRETYFLLWVERSFLRTYSQFRVSR
jgi:hypothetical protein